MSILSILIRFQNINNKNNKNSIIYNNNNNNRYGVNNITTDIDLDYSHGIGGIGNLTNRIHASISKGLLHTL